MTENSNQNQWHKWEVQNTLGQSVNGFNKKEKIARKNDRKLQPEPLAQMGSREHALSKCEWV